MTHSLLHKSIVPQPHTNSTIITSFVNRYTIPGFNYQTRHMTGNNGITHTYSSGHNLPYNASRSKRQSGCLHEQNSGVISPELLSKSRTWPLSHEFRWRIKAICYLVTGDYPKPEITIPSTYMPTMSQNNGVRCKCDQSVNNPWGKRHYWALYRTSVEMPLLHCMTENWCCDWSPTMAPVSTAPLTKLAQDIQ